jgi:peptide methionine sulfoxide reductase
MSNNIQDNEVATLASGCFWCSEAVFKRIKGVISVVPGYSGGTTDNPSYDEVCGGNTGHAESVQIVFDPKPLEKYSKFFGTLMILQLLIDKATMLVLNTDRQFFFTIKNREKLLRN